MSENELVKLQIYNANGLITREFKAYAKRLDVLPARIFEKAFLALLTSEQESDTLERLRKLGIQKEA